MGRVAVYNRRKQPEVRFKTDAITKKNLHEIAEREGISLNVYMERLVRKEILERNIENKKR